MSRTVSAEQVQVASRRIEKVYGVLARVYDDFFDWALGPGRRYAVSRLDARPGHRVLEVGVGTGLSLPLYPPDCHVVGIDISEPMLDRARSRLDGLGRDNVLLERIDARALAFPDGYFDRVLAPYVISVVPDPGAVMAQVARVCKPGGRVIVVNKFQSRWAPIAAAERAVTPLSNWIGFRMDLPVEGVIATPGLRLTGRSGVNLLGLWTVLEFDRV